MSFDHPLHITAEELSQLKNDGRPVTLSYNGIELIGQIGEIYLAANDPNQFGSFDFSLTPECAATLNGQEIPANFTAFEIESIALLN